MRKLTKIYIFLFLSVVIYSQPNKIETKAWQLMSYNGSINLNGQYNQSFSGLRNTNSSNYTYGGGVDISTLSYVWHPNFLTLSISGGYQPQTGEFISSSIPDYFTNLSTKKYNIYARFFKNLDYKLSAYVSHNEQKGEDRLYDRDITTKKWGADFTYFGSYNIEAQLEHNSNRELNNLNSSELLYNLTALRSSIEKSYFKIDRNELDINIQRNTSEQKDLYKNSTDAAHFNFHNHLFLNKKETIPLNSNLIYSKIIGSVDFTSMGFNESISIPLAKQLNFNSYFGKGSSKRSSEITKYTKFNSILAYGLYKSLNTSISINYDNSDRNKKYMIESKKIRLSSVYNKKLPSIKGGISIRYNYINQRFNNKIEDNLLHVYNENHLLEDGSIVLLNSTNIIIGSIVVKDVTETIVYQENIDYILTQVGNFVQIQRLIGGDISNNMVVYIDYDAIQNNSYAYNSESGEFEISLDCLNRFLILNYNNSYRNFELDNGEFINIGLDKYRSITYEALLKYKMFYAGVSYQDKNSTAFPFKLYSYNLSATGTISSKISYQLNAIFNNYTMYFSEGKTTKISSISSNFNYKLSYRTRLNFNLSFSKQKGNVQNYTLISGQSELRTRFNQLELSLGLNYYRSNVPNQNFSSQYIGSSISLTRNF